VRRGEVRGNARGGADEHCCTLSRGRKTVYITDNKVEDQLAPVLRL